MKHCYSCETHWDFDNRDKEWPEHEGQREKCPKCYSDDTGECTNENGCSPHKLRKQEVIDLHFANAEKKECELKLDSDQTAD